MKRILQSLCACAGLAFAVAPAHADLCDSVQGGAGASPTAATQLDVAFYNKLFAPADPKDPTNPKKLFPIADVGDPTWNAIIVQCNRQRDTKGGQITDVTQSTMDNAGKRQLASDDLEPKVIRGHYNFFGTIVTQQKYVYILSKSGGRWSMIIPYMAQIHQLHGGSIDLSMGRRTVDAAGNLGPSDKNGHAWKIYEQSEVITAPGKPPVLSATSRSIAETLCNMTTFFPGHEHAYDGENGANAYKRDRDNGAIMLGKIQFRYGQKAATTGNFGDRVVEGCRVPEADTVYVADKYNVLSPTSTTPKAFILDNFKQVAETYWTITDPKHPTDPTKTLFDLKLLLRGLNDQDFPKATLALLRDDDHLTANFATQFQTNDREMYKSNLIAFNNFSTMTLDTTYQHEVGHAFGLDDEYGTQGKLNDCLTSSYAGFHPTDYKMCDQETDQVRSIYHYIAASRYVTKQSECQTDPDCKKGEYCDAGVDLVKNACRPIKADGAACALAGGGHQCQSGQCGMGRCYTPGSVAMGGTCYIDGACSQGKCSSVDGFPGVCVCKTDSDCPGKWCNAGIDIVKNACQALKADGASCDLVGGAHQCKGGGCKFSRCYTPGSVAMGGSCFVDDACALGKCSSIDGTNGTCVCKTDADCPGKWCNAGTDIVKNACQALKADGASCDLVGGAHQCKGGGCKFSRCYKPGSVAMGGNCFVDDACALGKCSSIDGTNGTCVCKSDTDCGGGMWCDAGLDTKLNTCHAKLAKGASCGTAVSAGNDHKCKSGECSGFPNYVCK